MSSQCNPLHDAVQCGNVKNLRRLLALKIYDSNQKNQDGNTPLHIAAESGRINLVRVLLADPPVNTKIENKDGWTPIYFAVSEGHLKAFEEILRLGVNDINKQDSAGLTLLHLAIYQQHMPIAKLLLAEENLNFNIKDCEGKTPLHLVAKQGNKKLIDILLARGADLNLRDNTGKLSFDYGLGTLKKSIIRSFLYNIQEGQHHLFKGYLADSPSKENKLLLTCLVMMGVNIQPKDISNEQLRSDMETVLFHLKGALMKLAGKEISGEILPGMLKALPYALKIKKYMGGSSLPKDNNAALDIQIVEYLCQDLSRYKKKIKMINTTSYLGVKMVVFTELMQQMNFFHSLRKKLPKEIINQLANMLAESQQMSIYKYVIRLKEVVYFYSYFDNTLENFFQFYNALSEHDWTTEWTPMPSESEPLGLSPF